MFHGNSFSSGLHYCFQCICILIRHIYSHCGFTTESTGCIWYIRIRCHPDYPTSKMLKLFFHWRKVFCLINRAVSYNNVRSAFYNGSNQFFYILSAVLIIRIRIYNDICPISQTGIQSCHKSFSQSFILFKIHNIVNSPLFCDLSGMICTTIINDQIFYCIYSFYSFRQIVQRNFQCFLFIVTRNLNY